MKGVPTTSLSMKSPARAGCPGPFVEHRGRRGSPSQARLEFFEAGRSGLEFAAARWALVLRLAW
eukprot:14356266-Alexandrium_andersonii.AAC.1